MHLCILIYCTDMKESEIVRDYLCAQVIICLDTLSVTEIIFSVLLEDTQHDFKVYWLDIMLFLCMQFV